MCFLLNRSSSVCRKYMPKSSRACTATVKDKPFNLNSRIRDQLTGSDMLTFKQQCRQILEEENRLELAKEKAE